MGRVTLGPVLSNRAESPRRRCRCASLTAYDPEAAARRRAVTLPPDTQRGLKAQRRQCRSGETASAAWTTSSFACAADQGVNGGPARQRIPPEGDVHFAPASSSCSSRPDAPVSPRSQIAAPCAIA